MYKENEITFIPLFRIERFQIFQKDELDLAPPEEWFFNASSPCLYFILAKNKVTINKDSVIINEDYVTSEFFIQSESQIIREHILIPNSFIGGKAKTFSCKFPFSVLEFSNNDGKKMFYGKAPNLLEKFYSQVTKNEFLNYRILYVGQSKTGVMNRLLSHSTMQEIQEDCNLKYPDQEIFTMIFSIRKTNLLDFPKKPSAISRKKIKNNFLPYWSEPSRKQMEHTVNIAEACLINYFKPKYNSLFIKNTPNRIHKSFNELRQLNISKVKFGIGLENFDPKIYTNNVELSDEYIIEFDF